MYIFDLLVPSLPSLTVLLISQHLVFHQRQPMWMNVETRHSSSHRKYHHMGHSARVKKIPAFIPMQMILTYILEATCRSCREASLSCFCSKGLRWKNVFLPTMQKQPYRQDRLYCHTFSCSCYCSVMERTLKHLALGNENQKGNVLLEENLYNEGKKISRQ